MGHDLRLHLLFWVLTSTVEVLGAFWFAYFTPYSIFTRIGVIQNGIMTVENGLLFENVENVETGWRALEGLPAHQSPTNYQKRVVQPKAEKDFAEAGRFCMSYKSPIQPLPVRAPTHQIGPSCIRP